MSNYNCRLYGGNQMDMDENDIYEVTKNLIGEIKPIGETYTDDDRFKNLIIMTKVVDKLLVDIVDLHKYKDNHQYSMRRMAEYASKFFDRIGIK